MDIDHFKQINDTQGHDAGDLAIRHMAGLLLGHFRKSDIVCRFGGEEFAIALLGADLDNARNVAENLRQKVVDTPAIFQEATITLTISIGVAACAAGQAARIDALIKDADTALYAAKRNGRNQVVTSEGPA